jgi:putative heme iron utilization protein
MEIEHERMRQISSLIDLGYQKTVIELSELEDRFWDLRSAQFEVAENQDSAPSTLSELARDKDKNLRRRVAKNKSTPIPVLEELFCDQDDGVASLALRNPSVPRETRLDFLNHENTHVRLRATLVVLEHFEMPDQILKTLALDSESSIRQAVAKRSKTPVTILSVLAQQPESSVRQAVASNPHTPAEILSILAQQPESSVRQAVASNPHTPAEILSILAQQPESSVRQAVAGNPKTSVETISVLIGDNHLEVLETLLESNSKLSPDQRKDLLTKIASIRKEGRDFRVLNQNVHERRWQQFR